MAKRDDKTNAARILDRNKAQYQLLSYDSSLLSAGEVADCLGQDPAALFKTLVTVGKSGEHYVFMVPANQELDLKKAAKAAGEKSLDMILQKELLPLTGYIHGGCSPVGMKKQFQTFINHSAGKWAEICFSAGRAGNQVKMPLAELQKLLPVTLADVIKENGIP